MSQYLSFVAGEAISLDGGVLPGIVTGIDITGEFDVERKRLEGRSFRLALAKGYKDAVVIVTLELLPPDEMGQVKALEAAFKINFAGAKPKPQRIVNPFLDARGVTAVLFKRLVTRQTNQDDALLCELTFVEFEPVIGSLEARNKPATKAGQQALPSGQGGGGGGAAPQTPEQKGVARGVMTAENAANFIPNLFGLPSNGGGR